MARFFSDDSFWNQPLSADVTHDAQNERWIDLLREAQQTYPTRQGLHINIRQWTIPVFEADEQAPRHQIHRKIQDCYICQGFRLASEPRLSEGHPLGIHASFGDSVPIPIGAEPDPEEDSHIAIIAKDENRVYDMWQAARDKNGRWATNSAISYDLKGNGLFSAQTIAGIENGESIHYYGPCRATGVPLLAGLITREEMLAGEIRHKLAFACSAEGFERFIAPAIWTDGGVPAGIPAGSILQLSPEFDVEAAKLTSSGKTIARALQSYGAVLVDYADGVTLYAERESTPRCPTWEPLLTEHELDSIGVENFRILETGAVNRGGLNPIYHPKMSEKFFDYLKIHGTDFLREQSRVG